jgi:hypothetical protein
VAARLGERLALSGRSSVVYLLPAAARVAKVVLGAIAALAILQRFGVASGHS